uniref:RNA-dependent RNA polymerase n=1 Tax=Hubei tetragnatha maxillosa virus 9 TaxID=1923251 RepID=A0A1L3KP71_9VIRU|nr:RNA-dependent RNA polymerase [Hubei tetragnatha maxillosa virus 9]APG79183.1 RNA-dependent RNA polymerase [Hubei tetragnatha maxillosa virus 9]
MSYHESLFGRMDENMTFGSLRLYMWYSFFGHIFKGDPPIELEYISGFIVKSGKPLFIQKWGDNRVLEKVQLFYNLPNIIEALLTICQIRCSLIRSQVVLGGKRFDLNLLLDEFALRIAVSPKRIISDIRGYITFIIRFWGVRSKNMAAYRHVDWRMGSRVVGENFILEKVDHNMSALFWESKTIQAIYLEGRAVIKNLNFVYLDSICESLLDVSLEDSSSEDIIEVLKLFGSCMMIAGYGRALKYASSPRSAKPRDDIDPSVAAGVYDIMTDFNRLSLENGFVATTPDLWKTRCINMWQSKSAGVEPMKMEIEIKDDKPVKVSVSKKLLVGCLLGSKSFSKNELSKIYDLSNPGSVGYRDVPYKATRAIYAVRLPTLHAQVAVASHLVDYASSGGSLNAATGMRFDASHVTSGRNFMSGVRLYDNYDTIASSGDRNCMYIGIDLSEYDSHNVWNNFREPMLRALRDMDASKGEGYGPDKISWSEMVDFAFGDGHIYNSYWDNGREPLVVVQHEKETLYANSPFITIITVKEDVRRYKRSRGLKALKPGTYMVLKVEELLEAGKDIVWDDVYVAERHDGGDFVHLTSEASGELTTLIMNSVINLAMQRIIIRDLQDTPFGRRFLVRYNKAVGDDSEWYCQLLSSFETSEEIDDFFTFLAKKYDSFGHILSKYKVFICPYSSEYVQTFSRFGLYIPRDQISLINSERPRRVLDPIGFLASFKDILLTKMARGMNSTFARLVYSLFFRKLTTIDLRRHGIKVSNMEKRKLCKDLEPFYISPLKWKKIDTFKVEEMFVVTFSIIVMFMPFKARGGGVNPLNLGLSSTPSFFFWWCSNFDEMISASLISAYLYLKDKSVSLNLSDERPSDVKISASNNSLSAEDIFPPAVLEKAKALKSLGLDLGRYNAEEVPNRLFREGIKMERFMEKFQLMDRETTTEKFIMNLSRNFSLPRFSEDEWVLSFEFRFSDHAHKTERSYPFYVGLNSDYTVLLNDYGLNGFENRAKIGLEAIRKIISRDSSLKGVWTPEIISSQLDKYGINDIVDHDIGVAILSRMGFSERTCLEIVDLRLKDMLLSGRENSFGIFSDDFFASLDLVTESRLNSMSFPLKLSKGERVILLAFACQMAVYRTLAEGKRYYIPIDIKPRVVETGIMGIKFPRFYKAVVQSHRRDIGVTSKFLADLRDQNI